MGLCKSVNLFFHGADGRKEVGQDGRSLRVDFIKRTAVQDSSDGNVETNGAGKEL